MTPDSLPGPLRRAMLRWERWCYRRGVQDAARIYERAHLPYRAWCDLCGLPVPTESTSGPTEPIQACAPTMCLLEGHERYHRIEAL